MIIDRITIRDFQSIEHADLKLGPWTSLVGESDVGKSAVMRALYAALTNQRGDLFIRRGADECSVLFDLSDGRALQWRKARGRSGEYTIIDGDGASQTFEKTGGEVPPEVAALLRVAIPVAGEQLLPGIQRQHDPPFLFADTARRRAQILGEFDGTNILLHADGQLRKELRAEQSRATAAREAAQTAEAALQDIEWVDSAAELVAAAQRAHSAAETTEGRLDAFRARASEMAVLYGALVHANLTLDATPRAPAIDFDAIDERQHRLAAMLRLRTRIGPLERKVQLTHDHRPPPVVLVGEYLDHLAAMVNARTTANVAAIAHETVAGTLTSATIALDRAADALRLLVGTACSECGQPLTADALGVA